MVHKGTSSSEFLEVSRLYWALILLGLALLSSERLCVFGLHGAVYVVKISVLTSFSSPFNELSLVRLALDVVDEPLSFSAMTLLVGSSDP